MGNDTGEGVFPPQADMKRHHRALGKTDQNEVGVAQPPPPELRINESVEDWRGVLNTNETRVGLEVL